MALFFLSSCSLQEKVSPEIFIERLCAADENFIFDGESLFCGDGTYTYYITYSDLPLVAEIRIDGDENSKKINLACGETDKVELFIKCVESVIRVYSPDENIEEIHKEIFPLQESENSFYYYETKWYKYSSVLSEKGLYFSTENKKISPQSEVELSLKPNDIVDY